MRKHVKLQFLLVAGVAGLLGYVAAYGKLNPFQKADAGQPEQAKAVAPANLNKAGADKTAAKGKKPNVVYFLVDNLGYGELGCYGGGVLRGTKTSRIDKFAAQGMKLLNFAPESQCTPLPLGADDRAVLVAFREL
jgi:hypothetical protein